MLDLNGASALVTGGASGLGRACAVKLAAHGAKVLIADLDEAMGTVAAGECGGSFVKADVADAEQMQIAVDAACRLAPLRAAVNAAGIAHAMRTVNREGVPFDLAQFEFVVRVNLIGTFNCTRLAAAAMSKPLTSSASTQIGVSRRSVMWLAARNPGAKRSLATAISGMAASAGTSTATAPARRHMVATPAGAPVA